MASIAKKRVKEKADLKTCVYCGRVLPEKPVEVKVKTTTFNVCSDECRLETERYLALDKRFKLPLYIVIMAAAIVTLIIAISGGNMNYSYIMQVAVGIAFVIWPYPVSIFTTFQNNSIQFIVKVTRVVGIILAVFGAILLLFS